jgi:hypothetical protein
MATTVVKVAVATMVAILVATSNAKVEAAIMIDRGLKSHVRFVARRDTLRFVAGRGSTRISKALNAQPMRSQDHME